MVIQTNKSFWNYVENRISWKPSVLFPRTLWLERRNIAISEFIMALWLEKLAKKASQEKSLQLALFFFLFLSLSPFFNCGCNKWVVLQKARLWWLSGFAVSDTIYVQSWIRDLKYVIPLPLFYTTLSVLLWYFSSFFLSAISSTFHIYCFLCFYFSSTQHSSC